MAAAESPSQSDPGPPGSRSPSAQRVLDAATRLFAEHGFHGVSTRQIAAAVGLNIATVHHHVGTKRDLYLEVIRGLYEQEHEIVDKIITYAGEGSHKNPAALRETLIRLSDMLVEYTNDHPARARLYIRRWLDPIDELRNEESELTLAIYRPINELLEAAREAGVIREDVDIPILLRTVDWIILNYFVCGSFALDDFRGDPHKEDHLVAFKKYLHDYLCRMLGL